MKNKLFLALFFAPLVCLMIWVAVLFAVRASGSDVKVSIDGFDPRDLLSGHYIQYTIDWDRTDCQQFANGICPKGEFCKSKHRFRIGVCRFYVPEMKARQLDRLFARRNTNNMVFEVVYSYGSFEPFAKQLLINGRDWTDYVDGKVPLLFEEESKSNRR